MIIIGGKDCELKHILGINFESTQLDNWKPKRSHIATQPTQIIQNIGKYCEYSYPEPKILNIGIASIGSATEIATRTLVRELLNIENIVSSRNPNQNNNLTVFCSGTTKY